MVNRVILIFYIAFTFTFTFYIYFIISGQSLTIILSTCTLYNKKNTADRKLILSPIVEQPCATYAFMKLFLSYPNQASHD